MKLTLSDTTIKLISLIHFYRGVSDNDKLIRAMSSSNILTKGGVEKASKEAQLGFCLDAVDAIASIFVDNDARTIKRHQATEYLDREEIDFIQSVISIDAVENVGNESDRE